MSILFFCQQVSHGELGRGMVNEVEEGRVNLKYDYNAQILQNALKE